MQNARLVKLIKHQKHPDISTVLNNVLGLALKNFLKGFKIAKLAVLEYLEWTFCSLRNHGAAIDLKNIRIYIFPLFRTRKLPTLNIFNDTPIPPFNWSWPVY